MIYIYSPGMLLVTIKKWPSGMLGDFISNLYFFHFYHSFNSEMLRFAWPYLFLEPHITGPDCVKTPFYRLKHSSGLHASNLAL